MALHDFRCSPCNYVAVDVNIPITLGAQSAVVQCPHCQSRMAWIPQVGRMDAANGPGFIGFDTFDGRNQKVHISSLKQLRDIERQSEVDHRNGEGQPLVFRAFSNTRSQLDQSALHPNFNGGESPTPEAKRRFGSSLVKSSEELPGEYGPGVSDENTSALPVD